MKVLGIDPGPTRSAWLLLVDGRPTAFGLEANETVLAKLRGELGLRPDPDVLVIEELTSYGAKVVDRGMFRTMTVAGRFEEAMHHVPCVYLPRATVSARLRAKGDAGVRAALVDHWGGKDAAIGRKASPGPLYGIANDVWSALAVAVAWREADGGSRPAPRHADQCALAPDHGGACMWVGGRRPEDPVYPRSAP